MCLCRHAMCLLAGMSRCRTRCIIWSLQRATARQVLGRLRSNGDSLLAVSAVVDGVITFEAPGDAERFAALLEADGIDEVRGAPHAVAGRWSGVRPAARPAVSPAPRRCLESPSPCNLLATTAPLVTAAEG